MKWLLLLGKGMEFQENESTISEERITGGGQPEKPVPVVPTAKCSSTPEELSVA